MRRKFLNKLIIISIITTTLITITPIPASAAWIQDSQSNWKYTEGYGYAVGWRQINGLSYYFDINGVMQTGVIQVDGKIYLLSGDGAMQLGTAIINGETYRSTSNGVFVDDPPTPSKGFDINGNSVIPYIPDQIIDKDDDDSSPTDPSSDSSDTSGSTSEYTVKYKDDDGTKLKTKTVEKGDTVTLYEPSKDGYTFVEWNTEEDGSGDSYDADEDITVKKNWTLYAEWEEEDDSEDSSTSDNDVAVEDITVTAEDDANSITTAGGTLQLTATVLPVDATDNSVTWSVTNVSGQATISSDGLLTAVSNGIVTVKATANDSSDIVGTKRITITGQSSSGTGTNTDTPTDTTTTTNDIYIGTNESSTALESGTYDTIRIADGDDLQLTGITADRIIINGGSKLTLTNCTIGTIDVYNTSDSTTLTLAAGTGTTITTTNLLKGATLSGNQFTTVNVNTTEAVTLDAPVTTVNVIMTSANITVNSAVTTMNIESTATKYTVKGSGTIAGNAIS